MSDDVDGAETTHPDRPRVSTREKRFELTAVILLALTALATAWSGYQASLWDGLQSSSYTQASAARTEAAQLHTEANQYRIADLTVFQAHVNALIDGDQEGADFYSERFRDEFAVAHQAWLALDPLNNSDAPATPLAMPEYQLAAEQSALELEAKADRLFTAGEDANAISDVYTLTTLLFAVVLFFTAVSERFEYERVRVGLLALGAIGLVSGLTVALAQPITTG